MRTNGNKPFVRRSETYNTMSFVYLFFVLQTVANVARQTQAAPAEDLIEDLPGHGKTPTAQYSGYLNATEGCDVKANGQCYLHYWFVSAKTNASEAPTVVWVNGGPGASSLLGLFEENGPLIVNAKGGLVENPWSWFNVANLVYLEAPVGVGFSYCDNMRHGKPCKSTDRTTASASRVALQDFFANKFPELVENDLYVTGESYAGVYVPTLAKEILDNTDLPLKAVAVGDPCTDNEAQDEAMDALWYANKYGLMDDNDYDFLVGNCGIDTFYNLMPRGGVAHTIVDFNTELLQIDDLEKRRVRAHELFDTVVMNGARVKIEQSALSTECTIAFRRFLVSSSNALSQSWKYLFINDYALFTPVSNAQDQHLMEYFNKADVRKAIHVENAPVPQYSIIAPANSLVYQKEYLACNWATNPILKISMVDIYKEIIPKLSRTWIYNGDADPCVSYEGTRKAVRKIGLKVARGGAYRPWFFDQGPVSLHFLAVKDSQFGPNLSFQDLGPQFGGEVMDFEEGLTFLTVHGSGHMVPQFRPQAALHFITAFLHDELLSPLLPTSLELADMTFHEFESSILNPWTEHAMSSP